MPPIAIARSVVRTMSRGSLVARARMLAQQEEQLARSRKLRARRRSRRGAASKAAAELPWSAATSTSGPGTAWPPRLRTEALQPLDDATSRPLDLVAFLAPDARDLLEDVDEPRPSPARRRREVGAAVERLQRRREPHAHRPPAGSGRRLHERHVDAIDVRPLFAIDLDRDEVAIEHVGHLRVLEALVLHHVAPVAGRIADRQEDRLVLAACFVERRRPPRDTSPRDCPCAAGGKGCARWRDD